MLKIFDNSLNFTALDFETAKGKRWSVCQIGMVKVDNGIVTTYNRLIQPPENDYALFNINFHGISPEHTKNSPTFDMLWDEIKPFLENRIVVAQNMSFDANCLKQTLEYYNIPKINFEARSTIGELYSDGIEKYFEKYNISIKHHDALSDAMACAISFQNPNNVGYYHTFKRDYYGEKLY